VCPSFNQLIQGKAFLGDILALIGAWMAVGYLLIGRRLRSGISLLSYIFIVYTAASFVLLLIMILAGYSPFGYSWKTFIWFFLLALIPQLLGHTTYNWALGYLPAAFVSVTLLGEPIGSAILAYIFLDEKPTSIKLIGAILILVGIYITSRIRIKSNVQEEI
jgi:drug/metabolite transporter (DMT)-like permease